MFKSLYAWLKKIEIPNVQRDYISRLDWECLGILLEGLFEVSMERAVCVSLLENATPVTPEVEEENDKICS